MRGGGGGSDPADSEQTESLNDDTSGGDTSTTLNDDTGEYDTNEEGRGGSSSGTIEMTIQNDNSYELSYRFYARTDEGTYPDGRRKMGSWVNLVDKQRLEAPTTKGGARLLKDNSSNSNWTKYVIGIDKSEGYVEFGFEVRTLTSSAVYSYRFWSASDSAKETVNKIMIHIIGYTGELDMTINVNDKEIVTKKESQSRSSQSYKRPNYYFKTGNKIRVNTWKTSDYRNKTTRFYARKTADGKWDRLLDATNGDHEFDIDDDYVEFGFEFDIVWGTNWPYSGVFWTLADTRKEAVDNIYIEMDGSISMAQIKILVNMEKRYVKDKLQDGSPHYFKQTDEIRLKTWKTGLYSNKAACLYGRKSSGGLWTKLLEFTDGDHEKFIPDNSGYVEYGFEFDILGGTDWPYSGVFWTAADSAKKKVEDIYIEMRGTSIAADFRVWVNGNMVVRENNCSSHVQHYFKTTNKIRIKTYKTTNYTTSPQRIYARKNPSAKWDIVLDEGNGDHEKLIDDDYIEFGFEFDVVAGRDWPFSRVFWTAADSAKERVDDIYIEMTGTTLKVNLKIDVNGKNRYSNTNLSSGSQHFWRTWDGTRIRTYKTSAYGAKAQRVYASNPGQGWTCVLDKTNGDHTIYVSGYTQFGFEFDIKDGTDWPFSRPFWYEERDGKAEDIYIRMTGTIRMADLDIYVNGNRIYHNTNLSSGSRYDW